MVLHFHSSSLISVDKSFPEAAWDVIWGIVYSLSIEKFFQKCKTIPLHFVHYIFTLEYIIILPGICYRFKYIMNFIIFNESINKYFQFSQF